MSCCSLPPPSTEPRYRLPGFLAPLLQAWEQECPGVAEAVALTVGNGDWDRMGETPDGHVPPFTDAGAAAAALAELEAGLLAKDAARARREGPWAVRIGLARYTPTLDTASQAYLEAQKARVAKAAEPVLLYVQPSSL